MTLRLIIALLLSQVGGLLSAFAAASSTSHPLSIYSVSVGGKSVSPGDDRELSLGSRPESITFEFGPLPNSHWSPVRLRYKMEGFDNDWHDGGAEMGIMVRFSDARGDQIDQTTFPVIGESAGWDPSLTDPKFIHRREILTVPLRASRLWVVISSGVGPPSTVGIHVVDDLVVSRFSSSPDTQEILLKPTFNRESASDAEVSSPPGWMHDGTHPSMALVVEHGRNLKSKAMAVLDNDSQGHAEWHNRRETLPHVEPGDRILLEWNEAFSTGDGNLRKANYANLPPGEYRFRVIEVTAMGASTGIEDSLKILVPPPFWQTPFFWPTLIVLAMGAAVGIGRYAAWYRMRREVQRLQQQRALEQERLRIAQDIHDDLGARVTQISLLSAMARNNNLPEQARNDFDTISRLTRELVSALYETVWAVNPENDNLDALGNYLCQMINQLCEQAHLRCRLDVALLPTSIPLSSQTRHNIIMAVKEAVNNVIKHAKASEITLRVTYDTNNLSIYVSDNGSGFDPSQHSNGHGLINLKRRLADIGGNCSIQSLPGKGTTVNLQLAIKSVA